MMSQFYSVSKLVCERQEGYECDCYSCQHELISSFHLAYFVHFGLRFESFERSGERYLFEITPNVIAKSFEIMEDRCKSLRQIQSLENICLHSLLKDQILLRNVALPSSMRLKLENFEGAFDILDKALTETPGNTIFRPFNFPKFLFRHKNWFITGFRREDLM